MPACERVGGELASGGSSNATNNIAKKYVRRQLDSQEGEASVKQKGREDAGGMDEAGREASNFANDKAEDALEADLTSIRVNQKAAFNSPVWFNVGWKQP